MAVFVVKYFHIQINGQVMDLLVGSIIKEASVYLAVNVQTMKMKSGDDAPWRYAADEIVTMLNNVRGEGADGT